MVRLICLVLALTGSLAMYGQSTESLTMVPRLGGAHFEYRKDTSIFDVSHREVLDIMFKDQQAYDLFRKARNQSRVAGLMGFTGVGMVVVPLFTAATGGEPEWGLAAGGTALIVASIPFQRAFRRNAQEAVDAFNKRHTAFKPRVDYYVAGLGARLVIRF